MSEATQVPNQSLEQTLNKTDLGHTIYEHRKLFFGLIIAVLVGVTAWVIFKQVQHSKAMDQSVQVFEFQNKIWEGAKDGKVTVPELLKQFEALDKEVQSSTAMIPVALEMGKFLIDKNALTEAETVLSKVNTSHPVTSFFVGLQRSVALEKLGKVPEAIAVLENLAKDKDALMAARVNLELGRLNLAIDEKGKAQTHFEYVLNTWPNDEYAKLAKLYLAKIAE